MEVEARGKRRTVYLTDHLWRLARSWAIANDQTVSEVVEQTLLIALVGLRAEAVAEAQKAGRRLEPADARPAPKPVIVSPMDFHTPKTPVAKPARPAPKPVIAPANTPVSPHEAKMSIDEPWQSLDKPFATFRPAPKPTSRKKR